MLWSTEVSQFNSVGLDKLVRILPQIIDYFTLIFSYMVIFIGILMPCK